MKAQHTAVIVSAIVLSVVGYVVWPWRGGESVMWYAHLPEALQGDLSILAIAVTATVAIGFVMTAVGRVGLPALALGGAVAYAFWMVVLTTSFSLHDPLPYFLYGQVVIGVLLGSGLATAMDRTWPAATPDAA